MCACVKKQTETDKREIGFLVLNVEEQVRRRERNKQKTIKTKPSTEFILAINHLVKKLNDSDSD
jgi:hypothetical protein